MPRSGQGPREVLELLPRFGEVVGEDPAIERDVVRQITWDSLLQGWCGPEEPEHIRHILGSNFARHPQPFQVGCTCSRRNLQEVLP